MPLTIWTSAITVARMRRTLDTRMARVFVSVVQRVVATHSIPESLAVMTARKFVLIVSPDAPEHEVQAIGATLETLQGDWVRPVARTMDALLSDINLGITDNVLLETDCSPDSLEAKLAEHLGRTVRRYELKWL